MSKPAADVIGAVEHESPSTSDKLDRIESPLATLAARGLSYWPRFAIEIRIPKRKGGVNQIKPLSPFPD